MSDPGRHLSAARASASATAEAHARYAREFAQRCDHERRRDVLAKADRLFPPVVARLRSGADLQGATTVGPGRTVWKFAETRESETVMGDDVSSTASWYFDLDRRVYRSGGRRGGRKMMAVDEKYVPVAELFDTLEKIAAGRPPAPAGPLERRPPDLASLPSDSALREEDQRSESEIGAWVAVAVLAVIAVVMLVAIVG